MRIAWFSPLPPLRSGIARYSADLLARLDGEQAIDRFVDGLGRTPPGARTFDAHDFVWKHRRNPYDLITYQLGNAPCHDFMWAYLARYPGLVVLHDPRLHHARARDLLSRQRGRRLPPRVLVRPPGRAARFRRVRGRGARRTDLLRLADAARRDGDGAAGRRPQPARRRRPARASIPARGSRRSISATRRPAFQTRRRASACARRSASRRPRCCSAPSGRSPRRNGSVRSSARSRRSCATDADVHLVLAGDASDYPALAEEVASPAVARRVHVMGYLPDEAVGDYLAATDACLCLRWPTALETSASWLHCLAASRPTVISDLAHLVDIPTVDPREWRRSPAPGIDPVGDRDRPAGRRRVAAAGHAPAGDGCAAARHARARRPCVLDGEPHARRDGRRLPPAPGAGRRPPGAGAGESAGAFHRGSRQPGARRSRANSASSSTSSARREISVTRFRFQLHPEAFD